MNGGQTVEARMDMALGDVIANQPRRGGGGGGRAPFNNRFNNRGRAPFNNTPYGGGGGGGGFRGGFQGGFRGGFQGGRGGFRGGRGGYGGGGGFGGGGGRARGVGVGGGGGVTGPVNRVYVGNISWQTSWQDLKDHMRQAGEVTYADIFQDESGRSKGCGVVEFTSPAEANNAVATLNDTVIGNTERLVFVRLDREEKSYGKFGRSMPGENLGRQVFIGNLSYQTTWQGLKDHFRAAGNVIRADVMTGPDQRSKGVGTVLFSQNFEAQNAAQSFNDTELDGRIIHVHVDQRA
eukprot:TRINITY_DN1055_c0_g1_i2.p1 TRINITY_DN1055_c0_g1~~TRINITY_DN1055_c0_g1_i2.p1  ORF type:complete len:292 (+),score=79.09 TRINITY_DN1055_c0_g1_i2:580-1455(+)